MVGDPKGIQGGGRRCVPRVPTMVDLVIHGNVLVPHGWDPGTRELSALRPPAQPVGYLLELFVGGHSHPIKDYGS